MPPFSSFIFLVEGNALVKGKTKRKKKENWADHILMQEEKVFFLSLATGAYFDLLGMKTGLRPFSDCFYPFGDLRSGSCSSVFTED